MKKSCIFTLIKYSINIFTMSRNKIANEKQKDERRAQILRTSLLLFSRKGLSATRINDIARESGISQGLVYHYYRSKEEIFTDLIRHACENMVAAARALEQMPIAPEQKIIRAVTVLLKGLDKNDETSWYYLLIVQAAISEAIPQQARELFLLSNAVQHEVITRILEEGQKKGSVKKHPAADLAMVFWTAVSGLAFGKAIHGESFHMPDPEILSAMFLEDRTFSR